MGEHITELIFVQLILMLAASLCGIVAFFLKRHIASQDELRTTLSARYDDLSKRFSDLNSNFARLLERDRMLRVSDYKHNVTQENEA